MTHDDVNAWLERYIAAWKSNDGFVVASCGLYSAIASKSPVSACGVYVGLC